MKNVKSWRSHMNSGQRSQREKRSSLISSFTGLSRLSNWKRRKIAWRPSKCVRDGECVVMALESRCCTLIEDREGLLICCSFPNCEILPIQNLYTMRTFAHAYRIAVESSANSQTDARKQHYTTEVFAL